MTPDQQRFTANTLRVIRGFPRSWLTRYRQAKKQARVERDQTRTKYEQARDRYERLLRRYPEEEATKMGETEATRAVEIGVTRSLHDAGHDLYYAARVAATEGVCTPVAMGGEVVAIVIPAGRPDSDGVVKDEAYWEELQQAIGRGAPSLLLGTSTRSLRRNLRALRQASEERAADGSD